MGVNPFTTGAVETCEKTGRARCEELRGIRFAEGAISEQAGTLSQNFDELSSSPGEVRSVDAGENSVKYRAVRRLPIARIGHEFRSTSVFVSP